MKSHQRAESLNADSARSTSTFAGFTPSGHISCPMCNYPLSGLPAEYACPECGFEYDSETCVLTSRHPIWFDYVQFAAFATLLLLLVPIVGTSVGDWRMWFFFGVIPYMTFSVLILRTYFRRRRYPAILVVGPEGLAFRTSGHKEFDYSLLPETESVTLKRKLSRIGYDLHIERIDSPTNVLGLPFHWNVKQLAAICDAVQARLQAKSS